jgi:2-polyprenyl-6-methoxyphenol hydroxylase-like FAD-dependent oxidoreductase
MMVSRTGFKEIAIAFRDDEQISTSRGRDRTSSRAGPVFPFRGAGPGVMARHLGDHAIIIGAGIGGLSAAAALAGHFARVTVLERDEFPSDPQPRAGAPQSFHIHVLLAGGLVALNRLLPGFDRDAVAAGAVPIEWGFDDHAEFPGLGAVPKRHLDLPGISASRALLEFTIRARVAALPNVTLQGRHRVRAIVAGRDGAVTGVECEGDEGGKTVLAADLVIDATGRGELARTVLAATGQPAVARTAIGIDVQYATASFAARPGGRDWRVGVTFPDAPTDTLSGYVSEVEGGTLMVLLSERHGAALPDNAGDFLALTRRLRTTTVSDAIGDARPLGRIHRFALPESGWWHYEKVAAVPRGLLAIGDAVCRFNPIYGQGMAVAAQEACILADLLQQRGGEGGDLLDGLGMAYFAAVAPLIGAAWAMSATPDFAHPMTRGDRPADLDQSLRFGGALLALAAADPEVHRTMMAVRHMVEPASALQDPELVRRVQAEMARQAAGQSADAAR